MSRWFSNKLEEVSLALGTPLHRRKETTAVIFFVVMVPITLMCWTWTIALILFPFTTLPVLAYLTWALLLDDRKVTGTATPFLRSWSVWKHFENYFPVKLHEGKGCKLEAEKSYLLCYHPHGIIGIGAFASNATLIPRMFPQLDLRLLTLDINFKTPLVRELFLHLGICNASKLTLSNLLTTGKSAMLVVGGAAEALDTLPGTNRLTLKNRQGFVRVALDTGASLVPVFGFGENDLFDIVQASGRFRSLQLRLEKIMGFSLPIFYGRGIFRRHLGILPHRKPVHVVVGAPIKVPKAPEHLRGENLYRTEEGKKLVDKYHSMYMDALRRLYDDNKNKWLLKRRESLAFASPHNLPKKSLSVPAPTTLKDVPTADALRSSKSMKMGKDSAKTK